MTNFGMKARSFAVATCLVSMASQVTAQQLPAANLVSAPPAQLDALASYGAGRGVPVVTWAGTPPEFQALARTLGAEHVLADEMPSGVYAQNVFDYVRNNVELEMRFGLAKGGYGALVAQSGTPFDQAELMYKLLRVAQVPVEYKLGTITLNATQFAQMTGSFTSASPIAVDARQACQLLADGGIPTSLGSGDCAGVSGSLSNVTFAHVWLSASIETAAGTPETRLYDPAFKQHALNAGIDIPDALGCGSFAASTCGTGLTSAAAPLTGSTPGSIRQLNDDAISTYLRNRAISLQGEISSTNRLALVEDIVGGKRLVNTTTTAGTSLPYTVASQAATWPTAIPDSFRTKLRVRFRSDSLRNTEQRSTDQIFFTDEIYGRVFQVNSEGYFKVNGGEVVIQPNTCPACTNFLVVFDVDHPYAAASGQYADEHIEMPMFTPEGGGELPAQGAFPLTLVTGVGNATEALEKHIAGVMEGQDGEFHDAWYFYNNQAMQTQRADRSYESKDQPMLAAKFLGQGTAADRLLQGMARASITRHHDLGIIYAHPQNPSSMSLMSVQSAISVNTHSSSNTSTWRTPVFETSAATWAMLEGSVAGQTANTGYGLSTARAFTISNGPYVGASFRMLTPAEILSTYAANSNDPFALRLRAAASAGYGVVLNSSSAGEVFFRNNSVAHTLYASMKGGSEYSTDPVAKAMKSIELTDQAAERKKYASVSPADGALTITQTDLVSGSGGFPAALPFTRTYRSDSHVRDSTYSDFSGTSTFETNNTTMSPSRRYEGPDSSVNARLGGGWTHNYDVYINYLSNGTKALGSDSAIEAASAIAGLWTILDASRNTSLTNRVSSVLAAHWLASKLSFNSAVVNLGGPTEAFQELADDTLYSPRGSSKLVRPNGDSGWGPGTQTFVYTGKDGDTINFKVGRYKSYPITASGGVAIPDPYFVADNWSFPDGTVVTFFYEDQWLVTSWVDSTYRGCGNFGGNLVCVGPPSAISAPRGLVLKRVYNNFGRELEFSHQSSTASLPHSSSAFGYETYTSAFRITRVTDENDRYVDYGTPGCSPYVTFTCDTITVTRSNNVGPGTLTDTYSYQAGNDSLTPAFTFKGNYRLRRWFTPEYPDPAQNAAYRTFAYDPLYRVYVTRDARGHATYHYAGGISGKENWKRAETVSGVGAVTVSVFDERNSLIKSINPNGHVTAMEYDNIGRLLSTTNPEGDRVVQTYDVRSNVRTVTRVAKPNSGLADLATSTTYGEAEDVFTCENPRTCNKPVIETDARGFSKRNTWDPDRGVLTRFEAGLNSSLTCHSSVGSSCPRTDLIYSPAQTNGVFMLRQTTQRLNASLNLVNTYTYNPATHWTLHTGVADSGSGRPNLTTTLAFDQVGNLTQYDGPRTDVTDVRDFVWDTQRRLRFAIEPDPDGSGPLPRTAVRTDYDRDGLIASSTKGRTTSASGSDFVAIETMTHGYDLVGNKIRTTSAAGVTQYSYDQDDKLLCTAVRMNPEAFGSLPLDDPATTQLLDDGACAHTAAGVHGADRITRNVYDLAAQILREQRAYGTALQQDYFTTEYTPNGKENWIEDAKANRSDYVYDGFDRLCRLYFPQTAVGTRLPNTGQAANTVLSCSSPNTGDYELYGYDENGNRTAFRKRGSGTASARTINYTYDALNRETRKNLPGSDTYDVHTRYDLASRKLFMHFGSSAGSVSNDCSASAAGIDYCYDRLGRLTRENAYGRPLDYQYDQTGNRDRITWPGGGLFVEYTYDAAGRMKHVCENSTDCQAGILATYNYDDLGRRGTVTRQNGVTSQLQYDGASRISSLAHDATGTAGDIIFGLPDYNPASQVRRRTLNNNVYAFVPPVSNKTYVPDGLNRYDTVADPGATADFDYDARGNLLTDGARIFAYDIENRLTGVSGSASMTVEYDPAGRLNRTVASGVSTIFLYDRDKLLGEYNGTGSGATVARRYVHGAGIDEPLVWYEGAGVGTKRWFHPDHQGSIVATSDGSGNATTYTYGPYGEPGGDVWTGARFRYTGQIALNNAAGLRLYYYKARVYDPALGRFLQTDPIGSRDDLNLYAYVYNDPLNKVDPDGEFFLQAAAMLGGAIANVVAQAVVDVAKGEFSGGAAYAGAAAGGAVQGLVLSTTGCMQCAGAAGGAVSSAVSQKIATGKIDGTQVAVSAGVGAATGGIPGVRVPGVTAGRNSWQAVGRSTNTKLANGTISLGGVAPTTMAKAVGAAAVESAPGAAVSTAASEGANAGINAAAGAVDNAKAGVRDAVNSVVRSVTPQVPACLTGRPCARP